MPAKSEYVKITPEIAAKMLDSKNPKNRRLSRASVLPLARDMAEGRWVSDVPIILDRYGNILDGQHRLAAIVESGTSVKMLVIRNATPDTRRVIDQGRKRSPADVLKLEGRYESVSASEASVLKTMVAGVGQHMPKLTINEFVDLYEQHQSAVKFSVESLRGGRTGKAVVRAAVARAWYHCDINRLSDFCTTLNTGLGRNGGDAGAALFLRFINNPGTKVTGRAPRNVVYMKAERAIRAYVDHEPLTQLRAIEAELFPLPGEFDALDR